MWTSLNVVQIYNIINGEFLNYSPYDIDGTGQQKVLPWVSRFITRGDDQLPYNEKFVCIHWGHYNSVATRLVLWYPMKKNDSWSYLKLSVSAQTHTSDGSVARNQKTTVVVVRVVILFCSDSKFFAVIVIHSLITQYTDCEKRNL